MEETKQVQTFGRKKNATAVAVCSAGRGNIRVNGKSMNFMEPVSMRMKAWEPILLLGQTRF